MQHLVLLENPSVKNKGSGYMYWLDLDGDGVLFQDRGTKINNRSKCLVRFNDFLLEDQAVTKYSQSEIFCKNSCAGHPR